MEVELSSSVSIRVLLKICRLFFLSNVLSVMIKDITTGFMENPQSIFIFTIVSLSKQELLLT